MKKLVLVYPIRDGCVLLGWKKRGLGEGLYNGFGGHVKTGEEIVVAAARELTEECCIIPLDPLKYCGALCFYYSDKEDKLVSVYTLQRWAGEATETEEMRPEWFNINALPFDRMWLDDRYWLYNALTGWFISGHFSFDQGKLIHIGLELHCEL